MAAGIANDAGMEPILDIRGLSKTYTGGFKALDNVDLQIRKGEIFALLGPNGAGKTTLIGSVCGMVRPTAGTIHAFGLDMKKHWREARQRIGLVPQELGFDIFDTVDRQMSYSRGLFGRAPDRERVTQILRSLQLEDKRRDQIRKLSGGMKRRVLIAKALSHDPDLLFLDEPTAGVDVELRRDMWRLIGQLREQGVTIILTTHYIEEAEEMADRVGIIDKGRILLVDEKHAIMARLGRTEAHFTLEQPMQAVPEALGRYNIHLHDDGRLLCYRGGNGTGNGKADVAEIARILVEQGIRFTALDQSESSLEDIFVEMMQDQEAGA
ncbi:MAG: ABC transporter ATP-binding protein [Novosphingobium sp.]|nr:ABC transporter ATP-binding protein [Novosphingobium sp.]